MAQIGWVTYNDDEDDKISIKMSKGNADAQGAAFSAQPPQDVYWPFGHKNLRHVTGKASTGKRSRLVVCSQDWTVYQNGGTWTNSETSVVYTLEGKMGERKPANHVP
jgi:hypothetical protein